MTHVAKAIADIEAAVDEIGLAEFARDAEVPYTTAIEWRKRGWRPKVIRTLEQFAAAAERRKARAAEAQARAA